MNSVFLAKQRGKIRHIFGQLRHRNGLWRIGVYVENQPFVVVHLPVPRLHLAALWIASSMMDGPPVMPRVGAADRLRHWCARHPTFKRRIWFHASSKRPLSITGRPTVSPPA